MSIISNQTLCEKHLNEWIKGSGVDQSIVLNSVKTIEDSSEIAKILNRDRWDHGGGWIVQGINIKTKQLSEWCQFKPDRPRVKDGKEVKYESPLNVETQPLFLPMPNDPDYWAKAQVAVNQPIVIVEGAKKAGAGLTAGFITIALPGVYNGIKKASNRQWILRPELKTFAQANRIIVLAFDADVVIKKEVREALRRTAKAFLAEDCIVRVVELPMETKGLDDYLVKHGIESVKNLINSALDFEAWDQDLDEEKAPTQSIVAAELADKYRNVLVWDTQEENWYRYQKKQIDDCELKGVWSRESEGNVLAVVQSELNAHRVIGKKGYSYDFARGVTRLLKGLLVGGNWNYMQGQLLPMANCVLNLKTRETLKHSPGYRFNWSLPFEYDPTATAGPITDWLLEATEESLEIVDLLLCYMNAVIFRRYKYQRFLELIGPGGSGKSTFIKLVTELIGIKNTHSTKLVELEGNRFETSNLKGKGLIVITDSDKYGGPVEVLKALTGEDPLRNEEKFRQAGDTFIFEGMVLIAANEPIQSSDYTSGLHRRRLTIPFTKQINDEQKRDLISEFKPYLPGLLNLVLDLSIDSDEFVRGMIVNTTKMVPALAEYQKKQLCETNPLADWMEQRIVLDEKEKTYIGTLNKNKDEYLYANYADYCDEYGKNKLSLNRFSSVLLDLCRSQLKIPYVEKLKRDKEGYAFKGLRIRTYSDNDPFPVTGESIKPNRKIEVEAEQLSFVPVTETDKDFLQEEYQKNETVEVFLNEEWQIGYKYMGRGNMQVKPNQFYSSLQKTYQVLNSNNEVVTLFADQVRRREENSPDPTDISSQF